MEQLVFLWIIVSVKLHNKNQCKVCIAMIYHRRGHLLLNNNTIISFCNKVTNLEILKRVVFCSIRIPPLSSFLFHSVYICSFAVLDKQMLENTEGAIKDGQFRETDNIEYIRRRKTK